jgi:type I restriction enzyme S subunit
VLYGKLRPNLGKVSQPPFAGVCSTDILPLLPGPTLDKSYLAHYLLQPSVVELATSRATGANLPRLSASALQAFQIPLPPLNEQRRIAAILDHADLIRARQAHVLEQLQSLPAALFESALSSGQIQYHRMGELIESLRIGLDRSAAEQDSSRAFTYLKMNSITRDGRLNMEASTRVDATNDEVSTYSAADGDLILNTRNSRELVGKSAVYRGAPVLFNNNLARIRFTADVVPDYVHQFLWSPDGRAQLDRRKSGTTNVFAMYAKDLNTILVPVVSHAAQREFATRVATVAIQIARVQRAIDLHDELCASLQSRAFRGEL